MEVSSSGKVTMPQETMRGAPSPELGKRRWAASSAMRGFGAHVGRLSLVTTTFVGSFVTIAAVLIARNAYLFSAKIYEDQDFAANTIAILRAKHFALLTGNYSKEGFYHPGPAFLYVQAAGESFFHDLLHVVPTPWNGQLLAILLANTALIAASLAVFARHTKSDQAVLACLTVALLFAAVHPLAVNSGWMPYVYFAPILLLLVSAASVATGQTVDLPLLALSSGLCINGQAEFLLFAPVTVLVSLAGLAIANRHDLRGMFRARAWHWAWAVAITALLMFPIALNTAVHWPGQFGKYIAYMHSISGHHLITHSLVFSVTYMLRFWWPGIPATTADIGGLYVAGLIGILALVLALRCSSSGLRRFLLWSLAMVGLTTLLFIYYVRTAVDDNGVKQVYLGYFYWAAPLLVILVAAVAVAMYPGRRRPVVLALAAAVAVSAVIAAVVPQHRDSPAGPPATYLGDPQLPRAVKAIAAEAGGRPMVLRLAQNDWIDAVGVVAYADRIGLRTCVAGSEWSVLFRAQSICTPGEIRTGVTFWFTPTGPHTPRGIPAIVRFPQTQTLVTRQPVAK